MDEKKADREFADNLGPFEKATATEYSAAVVYFSE